LVVVIHL